MAKYELTFLFDKNKKDMPSILEKYIKDTGAKKITQDDWGVKPLAYQIKKRDQAQYLHFTAEIDPGKISSLEQAIRLDENLLRHLIVRV